MAQIKIFGHRAHLDGARAAISDVVHEAVVACFALPPGKRFHRFIALAPEDFIHPADRSDRYTIIEVNLFTGRSRDAKAALIERLFDRFEADLGILPGDLEIVLIESPKENWGIRGKVADRLALDYKVEI